MGGTDRQTSERREGQAQGLRWGQTDRLGKGWIDGGWMCERKDVRKDSQKEGQRDQNMDEQRGG